MDDICKYKLELCSDYGIYIRCRIGGLKHIKFDKDGKTDWDFNGACCLIKNADYKGYCNLCVVYHSKGCEQFENGYTIQFAPLYNEFGQMILLEYDKDESYASIHGGGFKNYDTGEIMDAELTLWKYGTFTEFNNPLTKN